MEDPEYPLRRLLLRGSPIESLPRKMRELVDELTSTTPSRRTRVFDFLSGSDVSDIEPQIRALFTAYAMATDAFPSVPIWWHLTSSDVEPDPKRAWPLGPDGINPLGVTTVRVTGQPGDTFGGTERGSAAVYLTAKDRVAVCGDGDFTGSLRGRDVKLRVARWEVYRQSDAGAVRPGAGLEVFVSTAQPACIGTCFTTSLMGTQIAKLESAYGSGEVVFGPPDA